MPIIFADTLSPSWDLVADIQILLHFHFMQNAYLAGTLVAITAGLMGFFMVLRSQSFAGHSLANVGFAGATGAVLLGIPPVVGLFLAGVLAAIGIQTLNVAAGERRQSDIAVGAVLTASLALGFLFIHLATAEYAANVYNVLFGNVLGISDTDVGVIAYSTLVLLAVLIFIARPFFFASLDPDVAAASGVPVRLLAFGYLVLLALEVAVAVQIVGVLLIFALLVTPAAIAQYVTTRPAVAAALAVALALLFTWMGLAVGYFTLYPVGFFITTFAFGTYALVRGGRFVLKRAGQRHLALSHLERSGGEVMSVVVAGVLPPFTLNLWQDVQAMLSYDFMRQALLAGTILSIVAGLVGYFVVLRHQSFAGESLSDVAFAGALGRCSPGHQPACVLAGHHYRGGSGDGGIRRAVAGTRRGHWDGACLGAGIGGALPEPVHDAGQRDRHGLLRRNGVVRQPPGHLRRPDTYHRARQRTGGAPPPPHRASVALRLA